MVAKSIWTWLDYPSISSRLHLASRLFGFVVRERFSLVWSCVHLSTKYYVTRFFCLQLRTGAFRLDSGYSCHWKLGLSIYQDHHDGTQSLWQATSWAYTSDSLISLRLGYQALAVPGRLELRALEEGGGGGGGRRRGGEGYTPPGAYCVPRS